MKILSILVVFILLSCGEKKINQPTIYKKIYIITYNDNSIDTLIIVNSKKRNRIDIDESSCIVASSNSYCNGKKIILVNIIEITEQEHHDYKSKSSYIDRR